MTRERSLQLELFNQPGLNAQENKKRAYALRDILGRYEKAMLFFIIFIVTCSISFSLGVEKGKRVRAAAAIIMPDRAITIPDKNINPVVPVSSVAHIPAKAKTDAKNYTVQLATYQTKTYAQKEAERLKKKGFSPIVMAKGVYIILCVGNFTDKTSAQSLIPKLGKQYKGCFVRTL